MEKTVTVAPSSARWQVCQVIAPLPCAYQRLWPVFGLAALRNSSPRVSMQRSWNGGRACHYDAHDIPTPGSEIDSYNTCREVDILYRTTEIYFREQERYNECRVSYNKQERSILLCS